MNRFAILKGISPPPFKDDIAKEISEAVSKQEKNIVGPSILLQDLQNLRNQPPPVYMGYVPGNETIMSSLDIEETFLTVTTPSGRHYRIGRDQFHIHHRGVNGLLGSELHLNLPDNSALEIWADFHREGVPAVSYAQEPAVSYAQEMARMQRQRMERERWQSGQPL